jgi:hypothetical protein
MSRTNQEERDSRGRFPPGVSGNPRGRRPEIAKVRKLLEPHREELVKKAVDLALSGDSTALKVCLDKLAPAPKATAEPVKIPALMKAETLTAKATALVNAIAVGAVPPDVGSSLLTALNNVVRIEEHDELRRRIESLESQLAIR